jgi:hypothetical protein
MSPQQKVDASHTARHTVLKVKTTNTAIAIIDSVRFKVSSCLSEPGQFFSRGFVPSTTTEEQWTCPHYWRSIERSFRSNLLSGSKFVYQYTVCRSGKFDVCLATWLWESGIHARPIHQEDL